MSTKVLNISLNPSLEMVEEYMTHHKNLMRESDENIIKYFFDDDIKKGEMLLGNLHLLSFNALEAKNTVPFFKVKYTIQDDLILKYYPNITHQYFIVCFFVADKDFKQLNEDSYTKHKKGSWIILSSDDTSYRLQVLKNTKMQVISIFVPLEGLKLMINSNKDHYLRELIYMKDPILIYEATSVRLQKVFELIINNELSNFVEKVNFQMNLLFMIKIIFDQLSRNNAQALKDNLKNADIEALAQAEEMLLQNIQKAPSIQELASEAAMSPTKFKSTFKKVYGESVYKYYLRYKMEIAHSWLTENKMGVLEIAHKLGYKNLTHFSRTFKSYFGEFPSRYS